MDGKEEMKELDRKEGADGQLQMKEMSLAASKKHETRWVRLSAILLATAMLAGIIFLLFPIKRYFSSSSEQQPGFANLELRRAGWFARSHLLKMETSI